ncbi:MAG: hypothetical protein EOP05_01015 [Proteobacteria bacterium]|nr:MAG: hypothetical protein EOP05_01015 [Pseudomonadota bacterium]
MLFWIHVGRLVLQFIYHPYVREMLDRFHPSVSQNLGEAVLAWRDRTDYPPGITLRSSPSVSEGAVLISVPLFGQSSLQFFVTSYLLYQVIFHCVQTDTIDYQESEAQIDDAQNALYTCQQLIDRTMPT